MSEAGDLETPHHEVPPDVIVALAKLLGIDPVKEPQYLWIAEECAKADSTGMYTKGWKELVAEDGRLMYYNKQTKAMQQLHPVIEVFAEIYHKQKLYTKTTQQSNGRQDFDSAATRLAAVLSEVMARVTSKLPPTTPEIVEKLCVLLGVAPSELFLVRVVKQTLEAYVEKQFNLATLLTDLTGALQHLRTMRRQQVRVDLIRKPDAVVMCQECEGRAATVKCDNCEEFFCTDCYNATHATGSRRGHITSDVEQLACATCDKAIATSHCLSCGLFYCDSCFASTHAARPELHNHYKRVINGLVCSECEHFNASVLCEDCNDIFCTEDFIRLHRKGRRRHHVHLTIDNTGQVFRGGFLVPPEEAQVLVDRARSTAESGAWLAFKDDQLRTYWYHVTDKQVSRSNPYNT